MKKQSCILFLLFLLFNLTSGCDSKLTSDGLEAIYPNSVEKRFTKGGAPVEVVITLSDKEIDLTDYLTVLIEIEYKEGVEVAPPFLSDTIYGPLLLVEPPKEKTIWSEQKNIAINRWTYKFEPVTSGEFEIKPFDIRFRLRTEKRDQIEKWPVHQIRTEAISYRVKSVDIADTDDIKDIKGPILPDYNFLPVIIALSAIILICLTTVLFQRYKHLLNKDEIETKSTKNYYLEALRKLEELEKRDLISKEEFDQLHTELSNILRSYIELCFGLRAREQTTEEFVKNITNTPLFSSEQNNLLYRFLHLADLVKFATFDPGSKTSLDAMQNVRDFIKTTGKTDEI